MAIGLLSLLGSIRPCEASEESKTEPYPDGKPHLVYTVDSQGRKSGQYKELDPEGHVLISATYAKDVLNGPYTSYFPNHKVKINATYTDGKLASKYSEFAESGEVIVTANYKAGALNGQRQEFTSGKLTKKRSLEGRQADGHRRIAEGQDAWLAARIRRGSRADR